MMRIARYLGGLAAALTMALFGALPPAAHAAVTQDWAVITQGLAGGTLVLDANNNAYIVGSVPRSTIVLGKYAPNGTPLWQRSFDNPGTSEEGTWVTLDSAGNAIVTGRLVRASDGSSIGLVVLKYDAAGTLLWQDVIALAFSYALRAVTDPAGNVYVAGAGGDTRDILTFKYSPSGVREWSRSFSVSPSSLDGAASMAITAGGTVIVGGGAQATMAAVAYDSAGNQVWSKTITPASAANDIAIGRQGEFYLVGSLTLPDFSVQMFVIKHDANFNEIWRRTYAVGGMGSRAAVDSQGNAVIAGRTANAYFNWVTIKVDPNGNLLWSRTLDKQPSPDEVASALAIGPDDSIYVTGEAGWVSSANGNITTYLGATTEKYSPSGALVWSTQAQIPAFGRGIKVATDGSLFVSADGPYALLHYQQDGAGTPPPTATISASRTVGPEPLTVQFSSAGSTGSIVGYRWDFGDGSGSVEANPSHTFAAGTFVTTLTVTDNVGATAKSAPIAITANPGAPRPPEPVSVNFSSTTVRGGKTVQATAYVAFPVAGTNPLTLTLTSSAPGVAGVPASVSVPPGANSATFTVTTSKVRRSTAVTITASSNGASASGTLTVTR